ncbi:protein kinase [Sorangium sp. So ce295]|uniref:protein kinase domain-containing protein n=1 Tax=Sorangium sp. So ce295 TaxID=3133295 RepID=UPI003F605C1F
MAYTSADVRRPARHISALRDHDRRQIPCPLRRRRRRVRRRLPRRARGVRRARRDQVPQAARRALARGAAGFRSTAARRGAAPAPALAPLARHRPGARHRRLHGPGRRSRALLVLEWLDGETLASHLERLRAGGGGALSRREAILLLDPAVRALAVAHEQNIAHRDVKPENLFLAEAGGARTLKVLDFGIAKIIGDQRSRTAALASTAEGPSVFTPRYGAPEQFDKQRGATGPWTDVFALALVFVELVTGARALEGEGIVEIYSVVVDPALRPTLRARGVSAPDAVERVLSRALSVSPRDRYPDAGAFWRALIAAEGLEAELPSLPPRSPPAAREAETRVESGNALGGPAPGAEHAGTPAGIGFEPTVPHRTDPASLRPDGAPSAPAGAEPAQRPDHGAGAASGEAVVVRTARDERARPGRRGLVALALAASAVAGAAVAG